jgi:hypothetical protein
VKGWPHIIHRKCIAWLFFSLLVFVYAEKTFHIHEVPANKTQQTGVTSAGNNPVCSICDFTVAKDSLLPDFMAIEIPVTFSLKQYIIVPPSYYYLPDNFVSDRGPPLF